MSAPLLSISEIDRALDRVSPHKALAFSRRVIRILELNALARPRTTGNSYARLQVVNVGIGFAVGTDLGLKVRWSSFLTRPEYKPNTTAADFVREIIQFDVPDYRPTGEPMYVPRCPGQTGPRGGRCQAKGWRTRAKHITDPATGDYIQAEWCPEHIDAAIARAVAAPRPPSNTGGVLLGAFPLHDFDAYYRKNGYKVRHVDEAETTVRPRLRVIDGGLI